MNNIKVKVPDFVYEILDRFLIKEKFEKQLWKLKNGFFDKWLNFEKIKTNKNIFDIHYRAYLRKENWIFIIFDINNHDYEKIKNKLKNT